MRMGAGLGRRYKRAKVQVARRNGKKGTKSSSSEKKEDFSS